MRARRLGRWLVLPIAVLVASAVGTFGAGADDPVPGSQGTDTSLPPTESQVTVSGRGRWADLRITVNQTTNLTNQAVSVTWTGGRPTINGPGRFAGNYLQIMQCWGDDDGSVPGNPGPPPEQCVQGAVGATYGGISGGLFPPGYTLERIISRTDFENFDPSVGVLDERTGLVWRPFRPADGSAPIVTHTDPTFDPSIVGGQYWLNPFFNIVTTNEIAGGVTGPDGRGAELFEVQTGVESSGLGCGQRVQPDGLGGRTVPRCWIVVVPRGTPTEENAGTAFSDRPDQYGVVTSPLSASAWANRIAIPIEFNPVDSPCSLSAVERRISGSELALTAVASWQPVLCAGGDLPPYSYATLPDSGARQQLLIPAAGAPGMVVVSRPIDPAFQNPKNPIVYAPLTASGVVIGFNVERVPRSTAPEEAQQLAGVRVAQLNLTPRLVAKLLTQSYTSQVDIGRSSPYEWDDANPPHLGLDPDFVRFNPEFELLDVLNRRTFGGLQLPAGNSDLALQVWEWILADPEATAWLDGEPDEWGMVVNPVYSTNPRRNPTGVAFGAPVPNSFPKADPYCFQAPARGSVLPPPLCGTDWVPYVRSLTEAAQVTRSAADRPRIVENTFAQSASDAWSRALPQSIGQRAVLSITDSASARRYGLQVANLSRAGDDGETREFVAPNARGLQAGLRAMQARTVDGVLEPAPSSAQPGAYPLTALTYAAIAPLALDEDERDDYASFLEYATDLGQESGFRLGELPPGYVPLPTELRFLAFVMAAVVRSGELPPDPEPTETTTTTTTTTPPTTGAPTTTVPAPAVNATPFTPQPATNSSSGTRPSGGTSGAASPSGVATATTTATVPTSEPTPSSEPVASVSAETTEPPPDDTPSTTLAVAGSATPEQDMDPSRYAVPLLGGVALASALAALEITKRPRRGIGPATDPDAEPVPDEEPT